MTIRPLCLLDRFEFDHLIAIFDCRETAPKSL